MTTNTDYGWSALIGFLRQVLQGTCSGASEGTGTTEDYAIRNGRLCSKSQQYRCDTLWRRIGQDMGFFVSKLFKD